VDRNLQSIEFENVEKSHYNDSLQYAIIYDAYLDENLHNSILIPIFEVRS
jgi:hypothetical protein